MIQNDLDLDLDYSKQVKGKRSNFKITKQRQQEARKQIKTERQFTLSDNQIMKQSDGSQQSQGNNNNKNTLIYNNQQQIDDILQNEEDINLPINTSQGMLDQDVESKNDNYNYFKNFLLDDYMISSKATSVNSNDIKKIKLKQFDHIDRLEIPSLNNSNSLDFGEDKLVQKNMNKYQDQEQRSTFFKHSQQSKQKEASDSMNGSQNISQKSKKRVKLSQKNRYTQIFNNNNQDGQEDEYGQIQFYSPNIQNFNNDNKKDLMIFQFQNDSSQEQGAENSDNKSEKSNHKSNNNNNNIYSLNYNFPSDKQKDSIHPQLRRNKQSLFHTQNHLSSDENTQSEKQKSKSPLKRYNTEEYDIKKSQFNQGSQAIINQQEENKITSQSSNQVKQSQSSLFQQQKLKNKSQFSLSLHPRNRAKSQYILESDDKQNISD